MALSKPRRVDQEKVYKGNDGKPIHWSHYYGLNSISSTFGKTKFDYQGLYSFKLPDTAKVWVRSISKLYNAHASWIDPIFKSIFNTMEHSRRIKLKKNHPNDDVDGDREMITQLVLQEFYERENTPAVQKQVIVELQEKIELLSDAVRMKIKEDLSLAKDINGSIFSILRSLIGCAAQLVHCDMDYNHEYPQGQYIIIVASQDDTEVRVVPRSHSASRLNALNGVTSRGVVLHLDEFCVLVMHPKLFHSGGQSLLSPINLRIHFYIGWGGPDPNNQLFDTTHYLPDDAFKYAVVSVDAKRKLGKEARAQGREKKLLNLNHGR